MVRVLDQVLFDCDSYPNERKSRHLRAKCHMADDLGDQKLTSKMDKVDKLIKVTYKTNLKKSIKFLIVSVFMLVYCSVN